MVWACCRKLFCFGSIKPKQSYKSSRYTNEARLFSFPSTVTWDRFQRAQLIICFQFQWAGSCKSQPVWAEGSCLSLWSCPWSFSQSSNVRGRQRRAHTLRITLLTVRGGERGRFLTPCSTCHLTWITFTTSPESLQLAGLPGRTSWIQMWSAACWWGTERSGRPACWSATSPTDTQRNTSRLDLMSSQVSETKR